MRRRMRTPSWIRRCTAGNVNPVRCREILGPVDELGTRRIHRKPDTDLRKARVHDVLAMRWAVEPTLCDFRRRHRARGDIFAHDEVTTISGPRDARRG